MLKAVVFAMIVPAAICFAQADRAAVTGTISDPTHLPIVAAQVRVVYPGTGLKRETASSSAGVYSISELPIAEECFLEASAPGFQTVRTKPFVLEVGETRRLDLSLVVASVGATVDVQDVADPITLNTVAVDSLTSSQRLNDLPVNGRNWFSFMALAPGAVDGANGSNTSARFFARSEERR